MTLTIIPRSAWGARHDDGDGPAPLPAGETWLHHSAGLYPDLVWLDANADGVEDDEANAMRALELIGEQRFGRGISYTWVVMPSGRIYQGHSPNRLGSHTGGRNSIARAICWAGNYMTNKPTAAQVRATAWLLQEAVRRGWLRTAALRGGHRDVKPMTGDSVVTACPGDHAYAVIAEINRLAAGPPITEEDEMSAADSERIKQLVDVFDDYYTLTGGKAIGQGIYDTEQAVKQLAADVAAIKSGEVGGDLAPLDYDQLAAALLRTIATG